MASVIKGNKIWLTRGDSFKTGVEMERGEEPYTPEAGDVVRFALKRARMRKSEGGYLEFQDYVALVLKPIPTDTMVLELVPEDTKNLSFGPYKYDIEITHADGFVDTFIENEDFTITPEVD